MSQGGRSQECLGFLGSKECPLEDKSGSRKTLLTPWVSFYLWVLWTPSLAPRARAISCPPLCDAVIRWDQLCLEPIVMAEHGTPGKGCLSLVASRCPETLASVHWLRANRRLVSRVFSAPHASSLTSPGLPSTPTPIQLLIAAGESTENLKETH